MKGLFFGVLLTVPTLFYAAERDALLNTKPPKQAIEIVDLPGADEEVRKQLAVENTVSISKCTSLAINAQDNCVTIGTKAGEIHFVYLDKAGNMLTESKQVFPVGTRKIARTIFGNKRNLNLTANSDGTVALFQLSENKVAGQRYASKLPHKFYVNRQDITDAAFSPDDKLAFIAVKDRSSLIGEIKIYSLNDRRAAPLQYYSLGLRESIKSIAVASHAENELKIARLMGSGLLITGNFNSNPAIIRKRETVTGVLLENLRRPHAKIESFDVNQDGSLTVLAERNGIQIVTSDSLSLNRSVSLKGASKVHFNTNNDVVALTTDKTVLFYDYEQWKSWESYDSGYETVALGKDFLAKATDKQVVIATLAAFKKNAKQENEGQEFTGVSWNDDYYWENRSCWQRFWDCLCCRKKIEA